MVWKPSLNWLLRGLPLIGHAAACIVRVCNRQNPVRMLWAVVVLDSVLVSMEDSSMLESSLEAGEKGSLRYHVRRRSGPRPLVSES